MDGEGSLNPQVTAFKVDAILEWVRRLYERSAAWLEEPMKSEEHARGPADYEQDLRDMRELVRRSARDADVSIEWNGGSNRGSSPSWRNAVMTGIVTLIVISITGGVAMYGAYSSMSARMDAFEKRMDSIEQWRDTHYRGAD